MKLRFGTAGNGWLPAELESEGEIFTFDISHLPNDFLLELIEALAHVLRGPGEWTAVLPQEPVEVEWRFCRIQDGAVFSLVEFPDSQRRKGSGRKLLETSGYPLEIALPLWRGFRELAGRKFKEGFHTHWTHHWAHPFPEVALSRLSAAISSAKESADSPTQVRPDEPKTFPMVFRDPSLQEHCEKAAAAATGCPPDQLPVFGLMDAWQYFSLIEGEESPRASEAMDHLLSDELRDVLREWYRQSGDDMNPNALAFRERLSALAGERFG